MARPTEEICTRLQQNRIESHQARKLKELDRCWTLLEDAHVLSQPWAWLHVRVHGAMFVAAVVRQYFFGAAPADILVSDQWDFTCS